MKHRTGLLSLIGLCCVTALATGALALGGDAKPQQAKLGQPAPDFTLLDVNGVEKSLSQYKGKIVVLEWINPQCPFVVNCYESKAMQNAHKRSKELDKGIVWLAINATHTTTAERNAYWIKKHGLKYPILLDTNGKVGRLYGARRTPHMFVIDKEGILRYTGAIDDNKLGDKSSEEATNYVVNAVEQVVNGETVVPDKTKPYGCTVKYRPAGGV